MPPAHPHVTRLEAFANEKAGLGGGVADDIRRQLEEAGVTADVRAVAPHALPAEIRGAANRGDTVAVCGGDGTLMAAAEVLAGGSVALAPIPTGTLNHFARRIGVEGIPDAAAAIRAGHTSRVPIGVVDDRIFLNTATFGLYADVVRKRESLRQWLTKWPAASVAILLKLLTMRRLRVTLQVEGERLERFTPLVWVGVGWGSFPRVHQAPERRGRPDLEIVVVRPRGRFGIVGLALRFLRHLGRSDRPVSDPALEVIHARSLIIHSGEQIGVTLDGEVIRMDGPVYIGVVDHALRVIVPAEQAEQAETPASGPG
jgi:diacylglycerol kinase family enzyme